MKAPDKIYTDNRGVYAKLPIFSQIDANVEYIRKEALLEWLNERYKSTISNVGCYTGHSVWAEVIEHINEM